MLKWFVWFLAISLASGFLLIGCSDDDGVTGVDDQLAAPTNLQVVERSGNAVQITWTDNATGIDRLIVQRHSNRSLDSSPCQTGRLCCFA